MAGGGPAKREAIQKSDFALYLLLGVGHERLKERGHAVVCGGIKMLSRF